MQIKTLYIPFLLAGCGLFLSACDKKEIPCHVKDRFIYFDYPEQENTEYSVSFINTKDQEIELAIPVAFSGNSLTTDLSYSIEIAEEQTTLATSEYKLPKSTVFRAGLAKDTLRIRLIQSPRMDDLTLVLALRIKSNENFLAIMDGMTETKITVSNILSKPVWWDKQVEDYYLGQYSDKKYQLFLNEIFTDDFSALNEDEKRLYALQFKYFLQKNPQTEEDGTQMSVPIVG
ncbi:MAG: DUF4843 domain-containing protein [Bacteroidales bacterium]